MRRSRPSASATRSAKSLLSDLVRNSQEILPVSESRISSSSRNAAQTDSVTCHLFRKMGTEVPSVTDWIAIPGIPYPASWAGLIKKASDRRRARPQRLTRVSTFSSPHASQQRGGTGGAFTAPHSTLTRPLVSHQLVRGESRTGPDPRARRTGDAPSWSHAMAL